MDRERGKPKPFSYICCFSYVYVELDRRSKLDPKSTFSLDTEQASTAISFEIQRTEKNP